VRPACEQAVFGRRFKDAAATEATKRMSFMDIENGGQPRPRSNATGDRMCAYIKEDAAPCGARRLSGSRYCFFHDPKNAKKRRSASRSGGLKNRPVALPLTTPDVPLRDAQDVGRLLDRTINQVLRGEIDAKIANTVGYLGGAQDEGPGAR